MVANIRFLFVGTACSWHMLSVFAPRSVWSKWKTSCLLHGVGQRLQSVRKVLMFVEECAQPEVWVAHWATVDLESRIEIKLEKCLPSGMPFWNCITFLLALHFSWRCLFLTHAICFCSQQLTKQLSLHGFGQWHSWSQFGREQTCVVCRNSSN
jgi:hypothetical protein